MQLRLFPDPKPLVEKLGADFFRRLPQCPGVYWMTDAQGKVLYVGKAKNLRRRLSSYRVGNSDRMPRRTLRLLHSVSAIEWAECPSEGEALRRESILLLELKPRFNRAGVWRGPPRKLLWRVDRETLWIEVGIEDMSGWRGSPPVGAAAKHIRNLLFRTLWPVLHPERGWEGIPAGWLTSSIPAESALDGWDRHNVSGATLETWISGLLETGAPELLDWIEAKQALSVSAFEQSLQRECLQSLRDFFDPTPSVGLDSAASDPGLPPG